MKEVKFEELPDGQQFIGVWEHHGEIWSSTYVKRGSGVLEYTLYDDNGDMVDDFTDDPGSDPNQMLSIDSFKAYTL